MRTGSGPTPPVDVERIVVLVMEIFLMGLGIAADRSIQTPASKLFFSSVTAGSRRREDERSTLARDSRIRIGR